MEQFLVPCLDPGYQRAYMWSETGDGASVSVEIGTVRNVHKQTDSSEQPVSSLEKAL